MPRISTGQSLASFFVSVYSPARADSDLTLFFIVILKTQLTRRNLLLIYNWGVKSIRPADTHVSK